jgi:hypothetical protein
MPRVGKDNTAVEADEGKSWRIKMKPYSIMLMDWLDAIGVFTRFMFAIPKFLRTKFEIHKGN